MPPQNQPELGNKLIEELAALEHEQWMKWTRYLVGNLDYQIDMRLVEKWSKNWKPYSELSEEEKEKDRVWARKVLPFIRSFALTLLDEIGLEEKKVVGDWKPSDIESHGYNQAKQELDQQKEALKKKYGL